MPYFLFLFWSRTIYSVYMYIEHPSFSPLARQGQPSTPKRHTIIILFSALLNVLYCIIKRAFLNYYLLSNIRLAMDEWMMSLAHVSVPFPNNN